MNIKAASAKFISWKTESTHKQIVLPLLCPVPAMDWELSAPFSLSKKKEKVWICPFPDKQGVKGFSHISKAEQQFFPVPNDISQY